MILSIAINGIAVQKGDDLSPFLQVEPWEENCIETVPDCLIEDHPYSDRMTIVQKDITLRAMLKGGKVLECAVKAGYAFDFASVPRALNPIVPYNDALLAWGALVHDVAFNRQYRSLKFSADLIRWVAVYFGYSRVRAQLVYIAVITNIARRMWRDRDLFDIENSRFCNIRLIEGADRA